MKNERQNMFFPFPGNMMMFPNYMNDNNFENRISNIEKRIKTIENRISRLENPYQTNNQNEQSKYQSTQNNAGYNGEMYMM